MSKRPSTIGANPLDMVIGGGASPAPQPERPAAAPKAKAERPKPAAKDERFVDRYGRFTFFLPLELAEKYRDASYWLRVPLVELIETGLTREMTRLEKENSGPFDARSRPLKRGRRG